MASNRSYYRNCCEVNEKDVVEVLKKIKGMKDVALSGGSELVFYTKSGEKIDIEEKRKEEAAPETTIKSSRVLIADVTCRRHRGCQAALSPAKRPPVIFIFCFLHTASSHLVAADTLFLLFPIFFLIHMEFIKQTIAANPVVIFGKSYCPYCKKAVRIMELVGCPFLNINLDTLVFASLASGL